MFALTPNAKAMANAFKCRRARSLRELEAKPSQAPCEPGCMSTPAAPDQPGAMIDMRWSERFRLATFPLAMNRNDRRELTENYRPEGETAEQHVHCVFP